MKFTVMVEPAAKARPRATVIHGHASMYTPKKTVDLEQAIRKAGMEEGTTFDKDDALSMDIRFVVLKPKSAPKKRVFCTKRPDLDNMTKAVLDALNKYVYPDDSQIIALSTIKHYGEPPRIEVTIQKLTSIMT